MKNMKRISFAIAFVSLFALLGCEPEATSPTVVDTKTNIKASDLIGIWSRDVSVYGGFLGSGAIERDIVVFSDSGSAIFIHQNPEDDYGEVKIGSGASHRISKSDWSLDSNMIVFNSDPYLIMDLSARWPRIPKYVNRLDPIPWRNTGGIDYLTYTLSNMDSLALVERETDNQVRIYTDSTLKIYVLEGPYEFAVLSIQNGKNGKELHITDKHCFDSHKDTEEIASVCEVRTFTKIDLESLLSKTICVHSCIAVA